MGNELVNVKVMLGDTEVVLTCKAWLYNTAAIVHDLHSAVDDKVGGMCEFLFVILDSWSFDDPITIDRINTLMIPWVEAMCVAIVDVFDIRGEVFSSSQEPGETAWNA